MPAFKKLALVRAYLLFHLDHWHPSGPFPFCSWAEVLPHCKTFQWLHFALRILFKFLTTAFAQSSPSPQWLSSLLTHLSPIHPLCLSLCYFLRAMSWSRLDLLVKHSPCAHNYLFCICFPHRLKNSREAALSKWCPLSLPSDRHIYIFWM